MLLSACGSDSEKLSDLGPNSNCNDAQVLSELKTAYVVDASAKEFLRLSIDDAGAGLTNIEEFKDSLKDLSMYDTLIFEPKFQNFKSTGSGCYAEVEYMNIDVIAKVKHTTSPVKITNTEVENF